MRDGMSDETKHVTPSAPRQLSGAIKSALDFGMGRARGPHFTREDVSRLREIAMMMLLPAWGKHADVLNSLADRIETLLPSEDTAGVNPQSTRARPVPAALIPVLTREWFDAGFEKGWKAAMDIIREPDALEDYTNPLKHPLEEK